MVIYFCNENAAYNEAENRDYRDKLEFCILVSFAVNW